MAISACYAASALSALFIPRSKQRTGDGLLHFQQHRDFAMETRSLMRNPKARLAVIGTHSFGVGAALRFLVIAWVPVALKITSNKVPGFLTAMVAVESCWARARGAFVRLRPTRGRSRRRADRNWRLSSALRE